MNSTGKKIAAFAVGAAISAALFYARLWLRKRPRKIETRLA